MTSSGPQATMTDIRHRMLVDWNHTLAAYPRDTCIHQLFEAQARRAPHAVAVVCGDQQLTYRELDVRADELARYLQGLGVGPDVLVGICMHRSVELIVGILGTLKAGGAYVPLDPTYPKKRLAAMFEDVEMPVLLTQERVLAGLPEHGAHVVCLDRDRAAIADAPPPARPPAPVSVRNLCYVIFTSGSTGKPKAAAVYHGGWTNLMHWFVTEFGVTTTDRALVVSSFSFDITQRSIVIPLIAGAQLHLAASDFYNPELVLRTIHERRITLMNCSPSMFYLLIENPGATTYARLSSLRHLFLGGEAISATRLRDWVESGACTTEVVNVYGAAEATDVSTFYRLRDYARYAATSVPIGKPIFNSQVYVLDDDLEPVPFGESGEICIAGDGVGAGYINDAGLTSGKFVPNPFSDDPTALLYRTGDVARFLPDWDLEFVGRVDHQVKLRGYRIDLGDIESALRQSPVVREAVVLARQDEAGDQRLVAYVSLKESLTPRELGTRLRSFLKDRLPKYMLPNDYVPLDAMPLSPNGKIDRNALRALA
jgi:amino acid adenylation domain-containing protein